MISRCAFSVFDLLYLHGSLLEVLAVASVRACCALLVCSCLNALSIVHVLHFLDSRERSEQPLVFRFELQLTSGDRIGIDGFANVHSFWGFQYVLM